MKFNTLILSALLGFVLFGTANAHADDNEKAIQAATAQFYKALNILFTGDAEPMLQVWSHAEDVTYMGPAGGYQVGWNKVQKNWKDAAALKLGGKIEAVDLHVFVGEDLAISQNYEQGENIGPDGKAIQVKIRATNVFRKEQGAWKMISHQTDLLPFLEN